MLPIGLSREQIEFVDQQMRGPDGGRRAGSSSDHYEQRLTLHAHVGIRDLLGLPRVAGRRGPGSGADGVHAVITPEGVRFTLKGTRMTTRPRPVYVGSLPEAQVHSRADVLIFYRGHCRTRLGEEGTTAIVMVCGVISKAEFLRRAQFVPEGMPRGRAYVQSGPQRELAYDQMVDVSTDEELRRLIELFELLKHVGCDPTVEILRDLLRRDAERAAKMFAQRTHASAPLICPEAGGRTAVPIAGGYFCFGCRSLHSGASATLPALPLAGESVCVAAE